MSNDILLGRAPRPTDGEQLAKRIRKLLIAAEPANIACTARIAADLDGPDISSLEIELTGYVFADRLDQDRSQIDTQGAKISSEEAAIRQLRVLAAPMIVGGAEVTLEVEAQGIRFAWIETDAGELAVDPLEPSAEHPVSGFARASVAKEQLGDVVRVAAEGQLAALGVTLSTFALDVESIDEQTLRVAADAKLKKGLIGAMAHLTATASLDDQLGLTLRDIAIESGNPLVSAALGMARSKIAAYEGKRIDLASRMPAGLTLSNVKVRAGELVTAEVELVSGPNP